MTQEQAELGLVGDESFDAFYRAEYPAVARLAFVLVGRRDVAEELTQDGFLAAFRRWERIGGYESPEGWVRRVVVNRCVSDARRRVTEARLMLRLGAQRAQRAEDPVVSEADEELWAAVRALPRRQAQVVALRFVDDASVEQIASVLDCSEDTVRTHLRRGRLTLAKRLASDEREGGLDG